MHTRRRILLAAGLALGLLGVVKAQDTVYFVDRVANKDMTYVGSIVEESPLGIKLRLRGKEGEVKLIPAETITRVDYQDKEVAAVDYRRPLGKLELAYKESRPKQRGELLDQALEGFSKLNRTLARAEARRFVRFKMAEITTLQAQTDPARMDEAIKLLTEFKTAHSTGWQILPAMKMLGNLLEQAGKPDQARKIYEELAGLPDAPPVLQRESSLLVGKLLLREGKYVEAEQRLRKLATAFSSEDPQGSLVRAYLVQSQMGQKKLDSVARDLAQLIKSSTDSKLRALAYNLLGDYYRLRGQAEDAFWQYLRVEVQYPDDVEEYAKALYHLSTLFDKVKNDPIRGKEYAAKLRQPRFQGTIYQKLLLQQSSKTPE